jgi:hypothetical protein
VIGGVIVLLLLAIVVSFFRAPSDEDDEMSFSDVLAAGRAGEIRRIEMHGNDLEITTRDGDERVSRVGGDVDVRAALSDEGIALGGTNGIEFEFAHAASDEWLFWIFNLGIPAIFLAVTYYAVRNAVREGIRRGSGEIAARESD